MPRVLLAREAEKDRGRLPIVYRQAVDSAIDTLRTEPLRGKALQGKLAHLRSLRVGAYRLIYRVDASKKVVIVETVRHRSEAYR